MATPTKSGSEFLVNTTTAGSQIVPTITGLADGRFVVSWTDQSATGSDTSGWAIRAQVFKADGSPSGAEFLVNTTTDGVQKDTAITALFNGGFVVTWGDASLSGGDTSGWAIKAQVFNANGRLSGAEFLVNTTTASHQEYPAITALSDGRFVVTWEDSSASRDIRAQVFNADGSTSGAEFLVNGPAAEGLTYPAVTGLSNGGFVVTWQDWRQTGGDTSGWAIRARVFNADGSPSGGGFLVNTTTDDWQTHPDITALSDGGFVVTWYDSGDIRAQVFNADDSPSGGEFRVNTTTDSDQLGPSVTALPNGGFVVTWQDHSQSGGDTSSYAVRAQVFNADGSLSGAEFLVNTTTFNSQISPSISALGDGRFVVAWKDDSQTGGDTSQSAIRAQIFDPREAAVDLGGSKLNDNFIGTGFNDVMSGKKGNDTLLGQGGKDVLNGDKGNDILKGGGGRDKLSGNDGKDTLKGDNGNDKLIGGKGNDKLIGGKGDDVLLGGGGKDKLTGGRGQDDLTGGKGSDTFIFKSTGDTGKTASTRDLITDFKQGQGDVIDLSAIDAKAGGGNQAFTFVGTDGFSSTKGELRYKQSGTKTIIQGDIDGDGVKDFEIKLDGLITLSASDFIL